jgi:hypothetical protein
MIAWVRADSKCVKIFYKQYFKQLTSKSLYHTLKSNLRSHRLQTVGIFTACSRAGEDNQTMKKERDLLPWILGGLSAATIAVAFAAVSTHRDVPTLAPTSMVAAQVRPPVSPPALPAPSTAQAPSPTTAPDSAPTPAPPQAQSAAEPQVQAGQIWECTTKGVKTFSNNPCGEKSTLLEVSPINTMRATPAIHYARAYGSDPRYAPAYADQGVPADDEQYSEDYGSEAGGNSYTIIQGAGFVARRRPEHMHRPPPHHYPGHNSGPVRRN